MLYLPVGLLEPGMVLAKNIPSFNPFLPLMVHGQSLTQDVIDVLIIHGIKGCYVEHSMAEDIEYIEILEPEQKQEMLAAIKKEFEGTMQKGKKPGYKVISKMAETIVTSVLNYDQVLYNVMDIRDYDNYTYSHSLYVGMISVALGTQLKLKPTRLLELAEAGLLHDLGKLDIPNEIINKPGPLTDDEYEKIKEHPERAVQRLKGTQGCHANVLQGIALHHEHYDGNGYPYGLKGTEISSFGRMIAIADVFDALSAKRSYRHAWSTGQIMEYMTSRSGTQFDPGYLKAFLNAVTAYPVGTLVRLSDDSIGIVIGNHAEFPLRPTIRLLAPRELAAKEVNLSTEAFNITVIDAVTEPPEELFLGR